MLIKNVCMFASSSESLDEQYYSEAAEFGKLLAKYDMNLVYGGSSLGMMVKAAEAVKENGGSVIGVMPEKLYDFGVYKKDCDEFHKTECMRSRKKKLDEISDAVVALAGGFGTLEELSEMMVQKQLGYNNKAIVILNTNGFYDNLLKFFDIIGEQHFGRGDYSNLVFVAKTSLEAVEYLKNYVAVEKEILKEDIYK